jgi:hypothetical protein
MLHVFTLFFLNCWTGHIKPHILPLRSPDINPASYFFLGGGGATEQNLHCFFIFLRCQSTYTVSTRPFATAAESLLICAEKCMDSQGVCSDFVYLMAWLLISVLQLIFFNTSSVCISISLKLQMGYV